MSLLNASPNNARPVYTFLVVLGIISVLLGGWNMGRISYEYYLHLRDADSHLMSVNKAEGSSH